MDADVDLPFDGPVLVTAGALASVPLSTLPDALSTVQRHLSARTGEYRREYERVLVEADREVFLVESDHWLEIGDALGFDDRTRKAVRRTHETQLERSGSAHDRREEFESALEIRSAVVIGVA
jgi:hypothetical protein